MDDIDRAQELEERHRQDAFDRWAAPFSGESLSECEECDEAIPAARQALGGITRCIECQSDWERRHGRG